MKHWCASKTPQQLARRPQIIFCAAAGAGVRNTAAMLHVSRSLVQRSRRRWRECLEQPLAQRLSDRTRSGIPPTFTPEQICALITLACEPAARAGVALARWTYPDLADDAMARGRLDSISAHSVGRVLREVSLKPHRVQGWINTPRDGDFAARCHDVCETYRLAPAWGAAGIETRRIDEMTGAQALERAAPTQPARPGYAKPLRSASRTRRACIGRASAVRATADTKRRSCGLRRDDTERRGVGRGGLPDRDCRRYPVRSLSCGRSIVGQVMVPARPEQKGGKPSMDSP